MNRNTREHLADPEPPVTFLAPRHYDCRPRWIQRLAWYCRRVLRAVGLW